MSKTVDLRPRPVSSQKEEIFNNYSCNQIQGAISILEKRAQRVARIQNDNAKSDRVLASWGWLLYGVPYLFMEGNGKAKEDFEIILGEKEALEEIAVRKDCKFEQTTIHHTREGDY